VAGVDSGEQDAPPWGTIDETPRSSRRDPASCRDRSGQTQLQLYLVQVVDGQLVYAQDHRCEPPAPQVIRPEATAPASLINRDPFAHTIPTTETDPEGRGYAFLWDQAAAATP
jgi:hypothetical protein